MMIRWSRGVNVLSLASSPPAMLIGPLLGASEAFQRLLPCASGNAIVGAGQIRLGDLEIQDGLALGLVSRFDDLLRFVGVGGLEAGAFGGGLVHAVENSATVSAAG